MEKEQKQATAGDEKKTAATKDGLLVSLVKTFLGFNFLKMGTKKDF